MGLFLYYFFLSWQLDFWGTLWQFFFKSPWGLLCLLLSLTKIMTTHSILVADSMHCSDIFHPSPMSAGLKYKKDRKRCFEAGAWLETKDLQYWKLRLNWLAKMIMNQFILVQLLSFSKRTAIAGFNLSTLSMTKTINWHSRPLDHHGPVKN